MVIIVESSSNRLPAKVGLTLKGWRKPAQLKCASNQKTEVIFSPQVLCVCSMTSNRDEEQETLFFLIQNEYNIA